MTGTVNRAEPELMSLADVASDAALISDWFTLAEQTPSSYFQTPDWVLAWWTQADRPPTRVALWRDDDGSPAALVTLSQVGHRAHPKLRLSLGMLCNTGGGFGSDHSGWLVRPGWFPNVRAWLEHLPGRRPLMLYGAIAGVAEQLLPEGARRLAVNPCPRLDIPEEIDQLQASSQFKQQLRRRKRQLERQQVRFAWTPPGKVDPSIIDALWRLHRARRVMKTGSADSAFSWEKAELHRMLVSQATPDRGPAMVTAERGDEIVGVLYGLWWKDTFAYLQKGWDPSLARYSLGIVLVAESIRMAGQDGAKIYDFLRGAEPFKYRFGAHDLVDETWLLPRGLSGRLLLAKNALAERREHRRRDGADSGQHDE